jgi:hypothetical protein
LRIVDLDSEPRQALRQISTIDDKKLRSFLVWMVKQEISCHDDSSLWDKKMSFYPRFYCHRVSALYETSFHDENKSHIEVAVLFLLKMKSHLRLNIEQVKPHLRELGLSTGVCIWSISIRMRETIDMEKRCSQTTVTEHANKGNREVSTTPCLEHPRIQAGTALAISDLHI